MNSTQEPMTNRPKRRYTQEKIMFGMLIIFVGGVLAMTYVPEAWSGPLVGLITCLSIFLMFRSGK